MSLVHSHSSSWGWLGLVVQGECLMSHGYNRSAVLCCAQEYVSAFARSRGLQEDQPGTCSWLLDLKVCWKNTSFAYKQANKASFLHPTLIPPNPTLPPKPTPKPHLQTPTPHLKKPTSKPHALKPHPQSPTPTPLCGRATASPSAC